jgi:hypothetical protein
MIAPAALYSKVPFQALAVYLLLQKRLEQDGAIVFRVTGAVEQGDVTLFRCLEDGLPGVRVRFQLCPVTLLEFLPPGRVMGEPLAERLAGRHVFQPGFHLQRFFLDPTRPQPVHEEACSVAGFGAFVYAFCLEQEISSR